jgi:muconolactone D-isomerase
LHSESLSRAREIKVPLGKINTMNRIQAILTIDTDNLPENFQEILKHEQEVVAQWKDEGVERY